MEFYSLRYDSISRIIDFLVLQHVYSCSFPKLENLWKQTTKNRLCEIQKTSSTAEILQNWKSYTQPLGYRLVRITYNLKMHFTN